MLRFPEDPWAQTRAAELFVHIGAAAAADEAHTRALSHAQDATSRRECVSRWLGAVQALPSVDQLPLRVRATERALAVGEAEEAFRWAQSATTLAPNDPSLGLLFGRAAVALGNLVAAKVALERAAHHAEDDAGRAVVAAEMAEVAYLGGDLAEATAQAERALSLGSAASTRLKARNTLGKLLLAAAKWDEADVHFAHDAWAASAAGLRTEELRARLNRGIAMLSKGFSDEARAIFEAVLVEGERAGDARACAFAVENLSVVATLRHDYAQSLALTERTLKLRERIGDRLKTALVLSNLAELRRRLGLLDHAEHAVTFGRRTLGPGMPPAHSAFFSIQAARTALLRGNTVEARREATRALAESEAAGLRNYVCETCCVGARVALEDGDLARASELIDRARAEATTDELRAEMSLVAAAYARACGDEGDGLALEALAAARASGKEDLVIEAHALLAEIHRAAGRPETARAHVSGAVALRDQIASTLPGDVRSAFLSRPDLVALSKLHVALHEPAGQGESGDLSPVSQSSPRISSRPPSTLPRDIIGDDPAIRGLLAAVRKVARSSSTVLVRGESGTGKELVAEALHRASERASGPLVTVNCAALVETLLLQRALRAREGRVHRAPARAGAAASRWPRAARSSSTRSATSRRALRWRCSACCRSARSSASAAPRPIRANVRIICATHRDLQAMVERGEFREDLYYRLRGITLEVPRASRAHGRPAAHQRAPPRPASPLERGEAQKTLVRRRARAARPPPLARQRPRARERAARRLALRRGRRHHGGRPHRQRRRPPRRSASAPHASSAPPVSGDGWCDDARRGRRGGTRRSERPPCPPSRRTRRPSPTRRSGKGGASLPDIKRQIERDCIARASPRPRGTSRGRRRFSA